MKTNPVNPNDEQHFYVKSTHAKYMLGEQSSELVKMRVIRALKDVGQIRIDRVPTWLDEGDVAAKKPHQIEQEFFAMPGVLLQRKPYYQVVLSDDQIFKAKADHTYLISFKLRVKLDVLHANPEEEGMQIERPFGTEKFVAEVHFPPTRRLKKVNKKVQLAAYEVRGAEIKQIIDSTKFIVRAEEIEPIPGTFTDMFRLTFPYPPQDADIRIMWQWSR